MRTVNTFSITKTAEELVPDAVSRVGYMVATSLTLIILLGVALTWGKLPAVIPLFFTEPWGEARLAGREWILLLPGLSIATIMVNIMLGKAAQGSSELLPRMLSVASGMVALMLVVSLYGIVQSLTL